MRYLFLMLLIFSSFALAKNQTVYYEPSLVELKGVIKDLKFPGPPNYESIKNGDADEIGAYLILNSPIDVMLPSKLKNDSNDNDEPEENVKILQLAVENDSDWTKIKEGNYVQLSGTLFHCLTAHHHTRVLLWVEKVKVLSTQKASGIKLDISNEDQQFISHEHLQPST